MADNMAIWNQVENTDPSKTKEYRGKGGFAGTAVNFTYRVRMATQLWGPCGDKWGWTVIDNKVVEGPPIKDDNNQVICNQKNQFVQIELFYPGPSGEKARIPAFGATPMIYKDNRGIQFDEDCWKKSLTDAIGAALKQLGWNADIYESGYNRGPGRGGLQPSLTPPQQQQQQPRSTPSQPINDAKIDKSGWEQICGWVQTVFGEEHAAAVKTKILRVCGVQKQNEIPAGRLNGIIEAIKTKHKAICPDGYPQQQTTVDTVVP